MEKEPRRLTEKTEKTESDPSSRRLLEQSARYARIVLLLSFLGIYAHVSQLNLSPVYGSLPASIWHFKLLAGGCFVGWAGSVVLRDLLPIPPAQALPIVAVCIPCLQHYLGSCSQLLGPQWGPAATEGLTLFPLCVLTAASVADGWEGVRLTKLPTFVADAGPGVASWALLRYFESQAATRLPLVVGKLRILTRLGFEMLLALMYIALFPSKYLVYTAFPLFHTLLLNPHVPSPAATESLASAMLTDGWLLMERRESVTGYLSVIQNMKQGFRVMRCDHSLLGGEWINHRGGPVSEPIYGVFAMLEAVRLAENAQAVADENAQALVIGLGVGTTPSALVSHGINTTVVEMDPVVHELAARYFDLKENNPPVLQDAVRYVQSLAKTAPATYDYIIHDVFTGGAEPVDLFTLEFFEGLRSLLKPAGTVAINYAGDLSLPAPKVIYRTIKQVFPTCRVFRETPPDVEAIKSNGADFTNMVVFCKNSVDSPLTFRRPTPKDYLESSARREFLQLTNEVPEAEILGGNQELVRRNGTEKVAKWSVKSALGHWALMRTAVPAKVWERW
ncbi:hypothetical protein UVI_02016890 [Ustilaginoidea virens]|nr:hypothetical protein UVI_02016890 [Ustilaginoidea virens]